MDMLYDETHYTGMEPTVIAPILYSQSLVEF